MSRAQHMDYSRWLYRMMRRSERAYERELIHLRTPGKYSEPRWAASSFRSADFYHAMLANDFDRARAINEMGERQ